MPHRDELIKARVGILKMAAELKNITKACKLVGVSRSQFYAMRKAFQTYGREGLAPKIRRKPEMPNRTPLAIEGQIILKTRANPTISYLKLADKMKADGIKVTPTMVRYVWQRHGLSRRAARLQWLKRRTERPVETNGMTADPLLGTLATPHVSASLPSSTVSTTGTTSGDTMEPYNQGVR